jgi:hypothetical protein
MRQSGRPHSLAKHSALRAAGCGLHRLANQRRDMRDLFIAA